MRRIELPSDELAVELQKRLGDKKLADGTYDKTRRAVQYPDSMNLSEWSDIRAEVEKWAKGRGLEVSESMRIHHRPAAPQTKPGADSKGKEPEPRKSENLSPREAEERYSYLRNKSITELTDAEYEERLALAQTLSKKKGDKK